MKRSLHRFGVGCLLLASLSGCDKKSKPVEGASAEDAGAANESVVDPNLAKAVAAASARAKAPARRAAEAEGGPPPGGIFAPGEADKQVARGAPATITLGSQGNEPRLLLSPQPQPGARRTGVVRISLQADPRQTPRPIQFELSLEAAKGAAAADGEAKGRIPVVARVTGASVASRGAVPEEAKAQLGKLRGSEVAYDIAPNGAGENFRVQVAPGVSADDDLVRSLSEALATLTLPCPNQPVGAGAYWMATSREGVWGLDLVTYRLVKVEELQGERFKLSVSTKRYAAGTDFDRPGLPPDDKFTLAEFHSVAEGSLSRSADSALPNAANLNMLLDAVLIPASAPNQRQGVGAQTRVSLELSGPPSP